MDVLSMRDQAMTLPEAFDAVASSRAVLERCDRLAEHTDEPGRITRLYLTTAAQSVHATLRHWMAGAGLSVRVDAAGNIVGHRRAEHATDATRTLLLGSHLDTVPDSGKYDGILGVLVALAAVEALAEVELPFHVDVVGFSEEEGVRFSMPYLGSRASAGTFNPDWLSRRDAQGVSLRGAIEAFGLNPDELPDAAYRRGGVLGYAEVHLEQGPVLERLNRPLGVVSGIQGQSRLLVRFTGEAGHAGTVPMDQRRDALVAAARLAIEVQDYGRSLAGLRATVGLFKAHPNVRNVIPGSVEMSLDVRHALDDIRVTAVDALLETAERIAAEDGLRFEVIDRQSQPATHVGGALASALGEAVAASGITPVELPSGAGHDAVAVADLCPVSMLFIRHPEGISHHRDERVLPGDVAAAIETMARFILNLAARERDGALA